MEDAQGNGAYVPTNLRGYPGSGQPGWYCACGHLDASHQHTDRADDLRKPCNVCDCDNSHDVEFGTAVSAPSVPADNDRDK